MQPCQHQSSNNNSWVADHLEQTPPERANSAVERIPVVAKDALFHTPVIDAASDNHWAACKCILLDKLCNHTALSIHCVHVSTKAAGCWRFKRTVRRLLSACGLADWPARVIPRSNCGIDVTPAQKSHDNGGRKMSAMDSGTYLCRIIKA